MIAGAVLVVVATVVTTAVVAVLVGTPVGATVELTARVCEVAVPVLGSSSPPNSTTPPMPRPTTASTPAAITPERRRPLAATGGVAAMVIVGMTGGGPVGDAEITGAVGLAAGGDHVAIGCSASMPATPWSLTWSDHSLPSHQRSS